MQMRQFLYEPVSRGKRAGNYRRDAEECERRGFPTIAAVLRESANELYTVHNGSVHDGRGSDARGNDGVSTGYSRRNGRGGDRS